MGYMGILSKNIPKAIFYLLKGDYKGKTSSMGFCVHPGLWSCYSTGRAQGNF